MAPKSRAICLQSKRRCACGASTARDAREHTNADSCSANLKADDGFAHKIQSERLRNRVEQVGAMGVAMGGCGKASATMCSAGVMNKQ